MEDRRLLLRARRASVEVAAREARLHRGTVWRHDGVQVAATGLRHPGWNQVDVVERPREPRDTLRRAAAVLASVGHRPAAMSPAEDDPVAAVAAALGLEPVRPRVHLVLTAEAFRPPGRVEGVSVVEVEPGDEAALAEHAAVQAAVFALPETATWLAPMPRAAHARLFTGRRDGRAVATAMLCPDGDAAGVYGVATLPECRRQGIGALLTATATRAAFAAGHTLVHLHPSEQGLGMYAGLGYREVGRDVLYLAPAAAG